MRSIIEHLGSSDFPRIRVGIGRPAGEREPTGHVLARPTPSGRERFEETLDRAVEALEAIIEHGIEAAMNRFNGLPARGRA